MALRFMDGFDHYMSADILKKWTSVGSITIAPENARPGSQGCGALGANLNNTRFAKTLDDQGTWIVGLNFQVSSFVSHTLIVFRASDGTEQVSLRTDATGHLVFTRNGTVIGSAAAAVTAAATWYHLECKVVISNTVGTIEARVNGVAVIGPTGSLDTAAHASEVTARQIGICATNGGGTITVDDVVICDGTGSVNNSFVGAGRIITRRPDSVGTYTQWIPSGFSDNFANVQDDFMDSDTTFNQSSTAGDKDTYVMEDVPSGTIIGVQTNIFLRQDSGAGRTVRPVWRISSTNYTGTTVGVAGNYLDSMQVYDVSPATSSAWTDTELNAAEFGMELVS